MDGITSTVSGETIPLKQLELFTSPRRKRPPAVPHQAGSATSKAAAESIAPYQSARQARALELLRERGDQGLTRDELAELAGWPLQSVCSLVCGLVRQGLIVATTTTRPTRTGRQAEVLVAIGRAT